MITRSTPTINITPRVSKVIIKKQISGVNLREVLLTNQTSNKNIKLNTNKTNNIKRNKMCIKKTMVSIRRKTMNSSHQNSSISTKRRTKIMIKGKRKGN